VVVETAGDSPCGFDDPPGDVVELVVPAGGPLKDELVVQEVVV